MAVRFSKDLSVRTFSEDACATAEASEDVFFLASRLEHLTHLIQQLNELNCEATTYHQFYKHIHPRISSMLDLETKIKDNQSGEASLERIQTTILEKIQLLREKNWSLCSYFDQKYQPLSPKSRQRLMGVESLEDLSLSDS